MKETLIRKRNIKIVPNDAGTLGKRERNALSKREGILKVRLDDQEKVISVEYDLMKVSFEEIEKWISDSGISLPNNLFDRWKRGWTRFTEQNELDNLSAKPTSCCDDPKSSSMHCEKR
jgi:hypothetical protein